MIKATHLKKCRKILIAFLTNRPTVETVPIGRERGSRMILQQRNYDNISPR